MTARRVVLLLFVYLLLDLGNPMMPGAFAFDVADSIDAARTVRPVDAPPPPPAVLGSPVTPDPAIRSAWTVPRVPVPRPGPAWRALVRRLPPSTGPAASSDDH